VRERYIFNTDDCVARRAGRRSVIRAVHIRSAGLRLAAGGAVSPMPLCISIRDSPCENKQGEDAQTSAPPAAGARHRIDDAARGRRARQLRPLPLEQLWLLLGPADSPGRHCHFGRK
jgi:hypothetical protein